MGQNLDDVGQSRKNDASGVLGVTNEMREIAPDNFLNEENLKADQDRSERKKMHEQSAFMKKIFYKVRKLKRKQAFSKAEKSNAAKNKPKTKSR